MAHVILTDADLDNLGRLANAIDPASQRAIGDLAVFSPLLDEHRAVREYLRILLAPQAIGRGAIRMEDWIEWPEEQQRAYAELKKRLEY